MNIFCCLILPGGGIRGYMQALVLAEIEARAGRPIHELADLIVGTSTGGILGAGLALGNRLLGKGRVIDLAIKCPRCRTMNLLKAVSLDPEPPEAPTGERVVCGESLQRGRTG